MNKFPRITFKCYGRLMVEYFAGNIVLLGCAAEDQRDFMHT